VRPNLIHLVDVEVAKRGIERVVRFVHFFDAFFQHARSIPEKWAISYCNHGDEGEWENGGREKQKVLDLRRLLKKAVQQGRS
jgi:hypothetical protein